MLYLQILLIISLIACMFLRRNQSAHSNLIILAVSALLLITSIAKIWLGNSGTPASIKQLGGFIESEAYMLGKTFLEAESNTGTVLIIHPSDDAKKESITLRIRGLKAALKRQPHSVKLATYEITDLHPGQPDYATQMKILEHGIPIEMIKNWLNEYENIAGIVCFGLVHHSVAEELDTLNIPVLINSDTPLSRKWESALQQGKVFAFSTINDDIDWRTKPPKTSDLERVFRTRYSLHRKPEH